MEVAENGTNGNNQDEHGSSEDVVYINITLDSADFDDVVGHIQDILVEDNFQCLLNNFLDKYCCEFDYGEENKFHYTAIFQEYVAVIENYMEEELTKRLPDFNMAEFLAEVRLREGELDGEVFEVLSSFADFVSFKQLVLDFKAVRDGLVQDMSIGASSSASSSV